MEKFTQVLENSLIDIDMTKTEIYIMGDFNIDMMDSQNISTKDFKSFIKTIGLSNYQGNHQMYHRSK